LKTTIKTNAKNCSKRPFKNKHVENKISVNKTIKKEAKNFKFTWRKKEKLKTIATID